MPPRSSRGLTVLLFGGMVTAWGLNYVFVREGLAFSAPLWLAFLRSGIGAVGVAVYVGSMGPGSKLDPAGRRDALLLGLPNTAVFFGLWFVAAAAVAPGIAAVVVYTFPLWVALLSPSVLGHRLGLWQALAVASGFLGVVLVSQPWANGGAVPPWAVAALLVGALSWAAGTVLFQRRFRGEEMRVANAYQLAGGSLALFVAATVLEAHSLPQPGLPLLTVALYLGLVGTSFGYGVWFLLLARIPAPTLSGYVFVVPVVALVASFAVFRDTVSGVQAAGVALVLVSVYGSARAAGAFEGRPGLKGAA
ncbi:MAG: DMT family transporter [Candidatus Lutacidiplasmatales archaeon]